jgi:hypothetical protein
MSDTANEFELRDEFILKNVRFSLQTLFIVFGFFAVVMALVRGCPCISEARFNRVNDGMSPTEVLDAVSYPPAETCRVESQGRIRWMRWTAFNGDALAVEFNENVKVNAAYRWP